MRNNDILHRIRYTFDLSDSKMIVLNLRTDDVQDIMNLAGMPVSKHELSAFFRKPDHKHYRDCKDQILRNFLKGMQIRFCDGSRP